MWQVYFVFFFKQKTAYEIKECDWSSDVCSSDLIVPRPITPFGIGFVPPIFPGFGLPKLGLGVGGQLGKLFKSAKQFTKYTPSYTAFKFKIFGPKPKGIETGLRLRPIPRGFTWSKFIFGKRKKRRRKK